MYYACIEIGKKKCMENTEHANQLEIGKKYMLVTARSV